MTTDVDRATLARLDFVVEARTLLGEIRMGSTISAPAIDRIAASLGEAQQLLRNLLCRAPAGRE